MKNTVNNLFQWLVLAAGISLSLHAYSQQGAYADDGVENQSALSEYIQLYRRADCDYRDDADDKHSFETLFCEKFEALIISTLEDQTNNIDKKNKVILLTNISANITFVLAHIFLFIGCYLAFKEIRHANTLRSSGKEKELELKVGLEGVALKTSFLGFAILALALGFYFLYLKFVYPIIVV